MLGRIKAPVFIFPYNDVVITIEDTLVIFPNELLSIASTVSFAALAKEAVGQILVMLFERSSRIVAYEDIGTDVGIMCVVIFFLGLDVTIICVNNISILTYEVFDFTLVGISTIFLLAVEGLEVIAENISVMVNETLSLIAD